MTFIWNSSRHILDKRNEDRVRVRDRTLFNSERPSTPLFPLGSAPGTPVARTLALCSTRRSCSDTWPLDGPRTSCSGKSVLPCCTALSERHLSCELSLAIRSRGTLRRPRFHINGAGRTCQVGKIPLKKKKRIRYKVFTTCRNNHLQVKW